MDLRVASLDGENGGDDDGEAWVGRNGRNRRFDSLGRRQSYYSRDNRSTCPTHLHSSLASKYPAAARPIDNEAHTHSLSLSIYPHGLCMCALRAERAGGVVDDSSVDLSD